MFLTSGNVEASLLDLELSVAEALPTLVIDDFGEQVFQVLERDDEVRVEVLEFNPTDIESGAEQVA